MALTTLSFDNPEALTSAFAEDLVSILKTGIRTRGRASLVVSGGRTPLALFKQLSETNLEWDKVDITLADERWVDEDHADSNTSLVKNNLIKNKASAARFVELKSEPSDANEGVNAAEAALTSITELFGWFYLFSVFGFVVFLIGLALSKYGKVRLGPQDSTPSYSFFSWISMLLAAGFGVGLVFYGMAEPMTHYNACMGIAA